MTKNYIKRDALFRVLSWMDRPEVIAIKGPRQSGKTTLLEVLRGELENKKVHYFSFEDRNVLSQFEKDPVEFVEILLGKEKTYIFLDEYQYTKDGGQKLKLIYDKFKDKTKIIITGSNSLELENIASKYMVGRMLSISLYPLSFKEFLNTKEERILNLWKKRVEEIKRDTSWENKDPYEEEMRKNWEEYCLYGGYPAVVGEKDVSLKKDLLYALVDNYINKDIVGLLKKEDIEKFRNLAQIVAGQTAQILNYNQLSGDTGAYFEKVKHFLSVLEETFLIKRIYPYYSNLTTELKKKPKCYFFDAGLRNAIISSYGNLKIRPDKGEIVESTVLFNIIASLKRGGRVSFWRTSGGAEVDFIVQKDNEMLPVEVKYKRGKGSVSRSSYSFIKKYKPSNFFVLTDGYWEKKKVGETNICFIPVWYFHFFSE